MSDLEISEQGEKSKQLLTQEFNSSWNEIRLQIISNEATINSFNGWRKSERFNPELLKELEKIQNKLKNHFEEKWNKSYDSKTLEFDKPYYSQTYIIEEKHGGVTLYHLRKFYIVFHKDGFFNLTSELATENPLTCSKRLMTRKKDYGRIYTIEDQNDIKFDLTPAS
jgi:hypothetical protein